jgi:hypothetical protein
MYGRGITTLMRNEVLGVGPDASGGRAAQNRQIPHQRRRFDSGNG